MSDPRRILEQDQAVTAFVGTEETRQSVEHPPAHQPFRILVSFAHELHCGDQSGHPITRLDPLPRQAKLLGDGRGWIDCGHALGQLPIPAQ